MSENKDIDLERCSTVSRAQSKSCQPSSSPSVNGSCTISIQHLDGPTILINATIKENDDGYLVFSSAKQQINQALDRSWHQRLLKKFLMGVVVGTARVKQVIHCSPQPPSRENENPPTLPDRVYLEDFTPDPLLTEALHNPHLLLRRIPNPFNDDIPSSSPSEKNEDLSDQAARFSNNIDSKPTSTSIKPSPIIIIVAKTVISRSKVALLLILLLLLSPPLGIFVGICAHDAEVGIAVSAGVFALASFAQGFLAWVQG